MTFLTIEAFFNVWGSSQPVLGVKKTLSSGCYNMCFFCPIFNATITTAVVTI